MISFKSKIFLNIQSLPVDNLSDIISTVVSRLQKEKEDTFNLPIQKILENIKNYGKGKKNILILNSLHFSLNSVTSYSE